MPKKRILFHSNHPGVFTGFGGFIKELLTYLFKTEKYELGVFCSGITWDHPDNQRFPWWQRGALPNDKAELDRLGQDQHQLRLASYGSYNIDRAIKEFKPDVYVGVEDFWGLSYCLDRKWWNKINCVLSWTADSLPILPEAIEKAHKIKHHFVWADFAVQEFKRIALEAEKQVKKQEKDFYSRQWNNREEFQTAKSQLENWKKEAEERIQGFRRVGLLRGTVNTEVYRKISIQEKKELRKSFGIPDDVFLIGTLSRNQLRKLFPQLLEGFGILKRQHPETKPKLLMYTSFTEGWDIPRLMRENGIEQEDVFCVYRCKETGMWFVRNYSGEDIDNPKTGHKKSMTTVSITNGLSCEDLNKIYGMMDVFCLPITSGGMERALVEAKLCELITLVNPYSCAEDLCVPEAFSLALDFATYKEIGTQFNKAVPYPTSIAKRLKQVFAMSLDKREEMGEKARNWVLKNFSIEVIGKKYEELLDGMPEVKYDFNEEPTVTLKNPFAVIPEISDDLKWIQCLYKEILKCDGVSHDDPGLLSWIERLKCGVSREEVKKFFVSVAVSDNQKAGGEQKQTKIEDLFDNTGRKRFLLVIKEAIGDALYATCLLKSLKEQYPEHDIYVATDPICEDVFVGSDYIYKIIPYQPAFESEIFCTGFGNQKGFVDGYCFLTVFPQRFLNYLSHDKIAFQLEEKCIS